MALISSSLVINYCLVLVLTVCRIYVRPIAILIFFGEIGTLCWIYRKQLTLTLDEILSGCIKKLRQFVHAVGDILNKRKDESSLDAIIRGIYLICCLSLACMALNWIWKLFAWNLGSAFNSYDTVAEWNRWALDWADNELPTGTWRYPQLLPANWSLIYVLMGNTTLQFFAKSFMPLFTLFVLMMIIDLGWQEKNPGYLLGAAIAYLTLKKFLGTFLIEGLADMPCAFLAFTSLYFLKNHLPGMDTNWQSRQSEKGAVLIMLAAAGAGVTKQVGLEYLALFCLLFLLVYIRPVFLEDKRRGIRLLTIAVGITALVVAPWYIYKQVLIWRGVEKSEVDMIIQATEYSFRTSDIIQRFNSIRLSMGKYFYLFALIIPFSFYMEPFIRGANLLVALPLFMSWGIFASYDFRNLSPVLPIFALSTGLYFHLIAGKAFDIIRKIHLERVKCFFCLLAIVLLIFGAGSMLYPDEVLFNRHNQAVMQTFSPVINQKLEKALRGESDFTILTNYPLDYLPGMEGKKAITAFNDSTVTAMRSPTKA
jgi:hypothetical protein